MRKRSQIEDRSISAISTAVVVVVMVGDAASSDVILVKSWRGGGRGDKGRGVFSLWQEANAHVGRGVLGIAFQTKMLEPACVRWRRARMRK
jgi:hypothetical protein